MNKNDKSSIQGLFLFIFSVGKEKTKVFGLIRKQKLKHILERVVSENCDYAPSPPNANLNDWQNYKWGNLSCASYISRMFNIQIDVVNINKQVFNRRIKEKHDNELSKLRSSN